MPRKRKPVATSQTPSMRSSELSSEANEALNEALEEAKASVANAIETKGVEGGLMALTELVVGLHRALLTEEVTEEGFVQPREPERLRQKRLKAQAKKALIKSSCTRRGLDYKKWVKKHGNKGPWEVLGPLPPRHQGQPSHRSYSG